MRKVATIVLFFACGVPFVYGQSEIARHEVSATFSISGIDTRGAFNNDKSRDALYGFNLQGAHNLNRFFGLQGDFSYFRRSFNTGVGNADLTSHLSQIMGGIKVQDNSNTTRFKPFAQALVGIAHATNFPRVLRDDSQGKLVNARNDTGVAFGLGGGLDVRLMRKLDIRAFQIDYNPAHLNGDTFHNLRLGIGLKFRF
jgi:opacity protein-like surface antigen